MELHHRDFLEILGYLYLQYGKIDEANVIYHTLFELTEDRGIVALTYAYCLAKLGNFSQALNILKQILPEKLDSKEQSGYALLCANVYWNLGDEAEARRQFDAFVRNEKERTRHLPSSLSLLERDSEQRTAVKSQKEAPIEETLSPENIWKRILRFVARKDLEFVARKDLNREFGRQN